MQKEEARAKN